MARKLFCVVCTLLLWTATFSFSQGIVVWHAGTYWDIPASRIDSIVFYDKLSPVKDSVVCGHAFVDLGLPSGTLWATTNVGASSPFGCGDYFAWGEVKGWKSGKDLFQWSTYQWCGGNTTSLTKYCSNSYYGTPDGKSELLEEDDAAAVLWGGPWRMPTYDEQEELRKECVWTWVEKDGINGYEVKGCSGRSIFLPVSGYCYGTELRYTNLGRYWSSSTNYAMNYQASYLLFSKESVGNGGSDRCCGQVIRPVWKK